MTFSPTPGTNSRPRIVLVLAWLSALLWILPTSAHGQGICDRTPQVRDKLLELTGVSNCRDVTADHLAGIQGNLDLEDTGISSLKAHDFSGLSSLNWLNLSRNSLSELPEGVFKGLQSLRQLLLDDNSLRELPPGIFSGLNRLGSLSLSRNSLGEVPQGIFNGLNSLQDLGLSGNALSELPVGIFSGLHSLQHLFLLNNPLGALPATMFRGLSSLQSLSLDNTSLSELPQGIFNGLDSLVFLSLWLNNFSELPPGIFDDVLNTLGAAPNYAYGLKIDSYLKAKPSFASTEQVGFLGSIVKAKVVLSRALPVAVRVPYGVGGTATADNYKDLSPEPEAGLLFPAGETSKEITFTLLEGEDNAGKTIELTLGELSQIGLRRSDGAGPDAPYLQTETLLEPPNTAAADTITIASRNTAAGVCASTPQVRDKLTEAAGVSSCDQVTVGHLAGVTRLDLSGTGITWLERDDFSGLSNLQDLLLNNNRLRELPDEVFNGLSKLETLWLQDNLLRELPEGIFDDIVDTLEDLRVDPRLKAGLLFHLMEQNAVEGAFVRVRVWLSRALPVAVRVPYTAGGTASANEHGRLSPTPEDGLLFLAGERSNEITLTLSEDAEALGNTIVLTLGTISRIGLRRSDGGGSDAPGLGSEILLDRPADSASHTVTISDPNEPAEVCERTPQVKDQLMQATGISTCEDVTLADLSRAKILDLRWSDINSLQKHDFSGLSSLEYLWLRGNHLTELPEEVFRGLHNLIDLSLQENSLNTLAEGVFRDLNSLKLLYLNRTSLNTLPEQVFTGLHALERLWLQDNLLRELPEATFQGMNYLEELLLYNPLNELPQRSFQGLSNLERLALSGDNLTTLPTGIFNGLKKLQDLDLVANSLGELPAGVFSGLSNLESLRLGLYSLETLPAGVFSGLSNLRQLEILAHSLSDLPEGVLDDALETLGGNFTQGFALALDTFKADPLTLRGGLTVPRRLKAELAFDSTEQRAPEGAAVRVPVTLSRALPVAVRVPYTIGFSGATGGLRGVSPDPHSGLLFPAGETRGEISFTLLKDTRIQGERPLVLALGKPTEIGLRRSDGRGPDAPYLISESLVLRSDDSAVHTVTVFDSDPVDREPFCLSLWQGAPCSTVSNIPHVFAGPLSESLATTELVITHRDPGPAECEAALLFHRGTSPASAVSFSGRFPDGNLFRTTLPRGGAELLTLTAPDAQELTSGALYVFARSPCHAGSLQVQARHLLESPSDGETEELFSVAGQSEKDWLGDGDCRRLTALLGNGREVGLASVTAQPGQTAPPGTRLRFAEFDLKGNFVGGLGSLEISGQHQATSPWTLDRPAIIQMCLDVPGASNFQLAIAAMGTAASGAKVQFSTVSIPDDTGPDGAGPSP